MYCLITPNSNSIDTGLLITHYIPTLEALRYTESSQKAVTAMTGQNFLALNLRRLPSFFIESNQAFCVAKMRVQTSKPSISPIWMSVKTRSKVREQQVC